MTFKKIAVILIFFLMGFIFMRSPIPEVVNNISIVATNSTLNMMNLNTQDMSYQTYTGVTGEIIVAIIFVIMPISVIGRAWFAKIGLQMMKDPQFADSLGLNPAFRFLFTTLCFFIFLCSFIQQHIYLSKFESLKRHTKNENDEYKLI